MKHNKKVYLYLISSSLSYGAKPEDSLFVSVHHHTAEEAAKYNLIDLKQSIDVSFDYDPDRLNDDLINSLQQQKKKAQADHALAMKGFDDKINNLLAIENKE